MATLILLESSDIAAGYLADAARSLGLSPLYLCDLSTYTGDPRARILQEPHIDTQTHGVDALVRLVAERCPGPVEGVVTLVDAKLCTAVSLAEALGVRGLDRTVARLKDKSHVAMLLEEFSPPTVDFARGQAPLDDIARLFDEGSKVIVKPTHGAGAAGVFVLHDRDELEGLEQRLASQRLPAHLDSGRHVAQRFVQGALMSAEGYVLDGEITLLGFTDRSKVGATESRASFPADARLSRGAAAMTTWALHELVRRSYFWNGYFHVEFIVDGDHAWVIDANVGRLGGGPIGDLLSLSYGVPPVDIYRHVLDVSLFHREPAAPYRGPRREASSILYGLASGGPVERVAVARPIRSRHTVMIDGGDVVSPMGSDDWSWVGILTGLADETLSDIDAISIHSNGQSHRPCY